MLLISKNSKALLNQLNKFAVQCKQPLWSLKVFSFGLCDQIDKSLATCLKLLNKKFAYYNHNLVCSKNAQNFHCKKSIIQSLIHFRWKDCLIKLWGQLNILRSPRHHFVPSFINPIWYNRQYSEFGYCYHFVNVTGLYGYTGPKWSHYATSTVIEKPIGILTAKLEKLNFLPKLLITWRNSFSCCKACN